ncbi:hypothetical protein M0R89_18545 (plasmid) [Halorussus limi]|uniref:DUF7835 domain-containing protein n=1 Tax=Halorussus limi TaxID=2938695 RepID=A0A8U0I0I1_9EURY|nr:hypothetical protein [Halorussus limi]UPV76533.1 hypothetical protein M0R89_18545 [Halorussus limi]
MATQNSTFAETTEMCEECEESTPHDVTIEIQTESKKKENTEFSREPYRVTECMKCGETTAKRMNDA